ncbi:hypothetical protein BN2537_2399 [Streptomyces venezuelae]|nr:hypothetical protein BN2537_2399 [Streptomyces venezuelae]
MHQALEGIERSVRNLTAAETAVAEAELRIKHARSEVFEHIARLRAAVDAVHAPELVAALRHLYWQQPGVHGRPLAQAAGLELHDMLKAIGPTPSGIFCADCGAELLRTSRSWQPQSRFSAPRCRDCQDQKQDGVTRRNYGARLRSRFVDESPVQAPARDWRAASEMVLAFPPLSQNVERGSYEDHQMGVWRGWENARVVRGQLIRAAAGNDETVSIALAHAKQLVTAALRVADWDTARTREIVEPITGEPALALLTRLNVNVRNAEQAATRRAADAYPPDYEPSQAEVEEFWKRPGL